MRQLSKPGSHSRFHFSKWISDRAGRNSGSSGEGFRSRPGDTSDGGTNVDRGNRRRGNLHQIPIQETQLCCMLGNIYQREGFNRASGTEARGRLHQVSMLQVLTQISQASRYGYPLWSLYQRKTWKEN